MLRENGYDGEIQVGGIEGWKASGQELVSPAPE